MPIQSAFAFLIQPGKSEAAPPTISSKELKVGSDRLSSMLTGIFDGEGSARDFEVTFNSTAGSQQNDCRDLLITFQSAPSIASGLMIAERLQSVTDNRSGTGLLFLLLGPNGLNSRLVVSRFPTDQAILAEVNSSGLDVEFLEQVFIKRLSAYKAVMLEHKNPSSGFWSGVATDRQAGGSGEHMSEYWLVDFLNADFSETPAAGTRRLAMALKTAIKATPNLQIKSEIASASTLAAATFQGKTLSIDSFCNHYGFSIPTIEAVRNQLNKQSLFLKNFKFDPGEFRKTAPYRTVELSTGAMLTAPNDEFDKVFASKSSSNGEVEYSTKGRIQDQRLARK